VIRGSEVSVQGGFVIIALPDSEATAWWILLALYCIFESENTPSPRGGEMSGGLRRARSARLNPPFNIGWHKGGKSVHFTQILHWLDTWAIDLLQNKGNYSAYPPAGLKMAG
jgi:hypothetical protein